MHRSSLSGSDGGKHTAYTVLVWHIATIIVEVSHPSQPPSDDLQEDHKIAATHLSRYCAYLVAFCPELLPGDGEWYKKLYRDVKRDADRVMAAAPPKAGRYQKLVELLLSVDSNHHEVLKNGARLGKQLVESGTAWEALARFWSEMIVYVAPSENLKRHAEAISRGGELITLLCALLAHAGIIVPITTVMPDKSSLPFLYSYRKKEVPCPSLENGMSMIPHQVNQKMILALTASIMYWSLQKQPQSQFRAIQHAASVTIQSH
ncbi:hypothetical protein BAE44_0011814 [Dichanthelium oligosanthes]|uniref:Uncharacterized protein n=1 Tax=Dichanthelium oligosanthes TaxID=888268 RepID=A0A1E5VPV2_9POAL|nr:hypothetical protein BAE44_0011814 [Dichanthelium oligosanthes]